MPRKFFWLTLAMLAAVLVARLSVASAQSSCTTQTFYIDGKLTVCTVCCVYGSCTTTCI